MVLIDEDASASDEQVGVLAEASSSIKTISRDKVVLRNFGFYFIVAVSRYFATTALAYIY